MLEQTALRGLVLHAQASRATLAPRDSLESWSLGLRANRFRLYYQATWLGSKK